ncbi:MAG: phosphoserine transaminase [Bacillota bacterium]|nr:phosphoserine transaminase [Bacillota bacterium]
MHHKPNLKPKNPNFSSGPCAKHPGYNLSELSEAPLGRSHRSIISKSRIKEAIARTKDVLGIPTDYLVGIVPASDTGAFEMAMWNLLGKKKVEVIFFEAFGKAWADDITKHLKLDDVELHFAEYGDLPALNNFNFSNDLVLTWNGTTSGVKIPDGNFIPPDHEGLIICDATSAVFAMEIPWEKIDAVTFSWQKVLGGEAAHGMLVLSPRAVNRIETYTPPWPIPKIFRLKENGKLIKGVFEGSTINTPSMLCVEDYLEALKWAEKTGGLKSLIKHSEQNLMVVEKFVEERPWIDFLAREAKFRSNTSVCLVLDVSEDKLNKIIKLMETEQAAYDIASYRDAPDGLRFWCGATVEREDLELALEWLEWAYHSAL